MHKCTLALITCFLGCFSLGKAGDWSTDPAHWGLGFINFTPSTSSPAFQLYGTVFPQNAGIPIYLSPERTHLAGLLFAETPAEKLELTRLRMFPVEGQSFLVAGTFRPTEQRRIHYEHTFLLYVAERNGFIKILPETFGGGVWIAVEDLKRQGFSPESWQSYLHKEYSAFHLLPPDRFALNLRTEATADSDKLVPLRGDAFDIRLSGSFEGL